MGGGSERRVALKSWVRTRLIEGARPREEWRELWEATWEHLLATPVHDLLDVNAVRAATDALVDPDLVAELSRPVVANVAGVVIAELRADNEPVDRFLPPEAQDRLLEALARPGLVHPDWVRTMFRGEAAEAVLNDALYRALRDFSTLLPRLLVKVSPMGRFGVLGNAGAFAEKLIDELEKRIEPEIKTFLTESTGHVLERAAEFTIARIDDPASIEFRATLVRFMLSKSPAFFLDPADDELVGDIGAVVEMTARHLAASPEMRAAIHAWIDRAIDHCENKSVGEALALDGNRVRPPTDALADATWPAFVSVLTSPRAQAWIDELVDELIDQYEGTSERP